MSEIAVLCCSLLLLQQSLDVQLACPSLRRLLHAASQSCIMPASCPAPASAVCATSFTCSLPSCWLPFLQAFNTNYHDTGLFGVYATANKDDPVDDVAWAIMREISRMCYSPVDEDIIRAKNQLKAAILFSQDNLNGDLCLVDGNGLLVVSLMRWGVCVA